VRGEAEQRLTRPAAGKAEPFDVTTAALPSAQVEAEATGGTTDRVFVMLAQAGISFDEARENSSRCVASRCRSQPSLG
jgi:hypothetical protein